jgi:hypothetical protein
LEDTPQNRAAVPPSKNQFSRPAFPSLRLRALSSLRSGSLLAHATGTLKDAETRLLVGLREHIQPGAILAGDRADGLYVLLHWVNSLGADLGARLNARSRRVDFRTAIRRLGLRDGLFLWTKPKVASKLLSAQEWTQVPALN